MNDWLLLVIVAVPLIVAEIAALAEVIVARRDIGPARRAAWGVALLAVPAVSLLVYAVVRPPRSAPSPFTVSHPIDPRLETMVGAVERHVAGHLDDDAYDEIIARCTGS